MTSGHTVARNLYLPLIPDVFHLPLAPQPVVIRVSVVGTELGLQLCGATRLSFPSDSEDMPSRTRRAGSAYTLTPLLYNAWLTPGYTVEVLSSAHVTHQCRCEDPFNAVFNK